MTESHLGERVTLCGRVYEITGVTAMSVKPRLVYLEDVETREQVVVEAREFAGGPKRSSGPPQLR